MSRASWQKTTVLAGRLAAATMVLFGLTVTQSQAQQAAADASADDSLKEIVVTATRREETISHTALSITAFTQDTLTAQEVVSIGDLQRLTPGLGLSYGNLNPAGQSSGDTNISLRGIASVAGAPTTGVYIDDVPTHKLTVTGNGFGAQYPKIFDLDRVEVLRGPQGTLYGGSTMGGAVRFITTPPSLTEFTANAKAEGGFTQGGDPTYEFGAAIGGPIVADTLGFRFTAWTRNQGGYIDHVSRFTDTTLASNTNRDTQYMGRLQLLWSPFTALNVKASFLYQDQRTRDADQYWFNTPAINAPAVGFTATGALCNTLPNCARVLPAYTYPAYNMFGPGKTGGELYDPTTGSEQALLQPRTDHFYLPSLTIDYDLGLFTAHSISAFQSDSIEGYNDNSYRGGAPAISNTPAYPANFYYTFPQFLSYNLYNNHHDALSQELRFVSNPNGSPFSWIAGLYYYRDLLHYVQNSFGNLADEYAVVQGTTSQGILGYVLPPGLYFATYDNYNRSRNEAVFLDMNYKLLDNLKLEAGVRYSRDNQGIVTYGYGFNNRGLTTPTIANGGIVIGNSSGTAITPKAGLTYQINDRDMVYATASKGYRAGGYNAVPQFVFPSCQATLALLGLTQPPTHYDPDKVWTYELGSKWREMNGRFQLDASIYRTNWSNVQSQLSIPGCGQYTANTASAVVQGGDLQSALKLGDVTLSTEVAFTDATYKGSVYLLSTAPVKPVAIADRDRLLGVPLWSGSAGIKYDLRIFDKTPFVRVDYNFSSGVRRSTGPGTVGYTRDVYAAGSVNFLTIGAGVNYNSQLQLLINVKNVTNTQTALLEYGGTTPTRNSPVLFGTTFRPREYDLDVLYHF